MNWKDWLFPWRAKAKIEELQACLNRSVDAAPFTAKINLLEERLEQTIKSLKAALDEKHACATLLSSTRASEQDWRETANKIDLEKNELASLNRTLVDQLEHARADVEEWKGRVKVERKEREDVEKAIGGMKAEVLEAHTLAAKASKLQEALDHEIAEHRLAKEQVVGLTKWIRVAHRLDSPSPKGTIRRILQSARFRTTSRSGTVTAMALVCFAWTALAQAPFWRNPWSTNQAPPVIGTNLWVSNTASGDGWFFYNQPNSNVVARLRDITAATASGTNFNGIIVTNDIGQPARRVRSYYGSNIYTINTISSNGLTLPFASDFPTAASLLNRSALFNSNNVTFLENSYDGVNVNAWTFRTNGQSTFPATLNLASGSFISGFDVYCSSSGRFLWNVAGSATLNRIGNGVSLLPGIGLATNAFQVCLTNGEPAWLVNSNGNVAIGSNVPTAKLDVNGAAADPSLTPSANPQIVRFAAENVKLDAGMSLSAPYGPWLQARDIGGAGLAKSLSINPLGGNVGIGTNNPQAALHVQGAQAELLRVDTISGGTGALTVSSNPVVRLRTQQATNQPIACYGAMMMPLTNILAIGPTAYTNINGYSVLNTNWFRCNTNTGSISNVFAGYYRINISASILAGNNEALEGCLLTNGVDSECVSFYKVYDAASRFDVLSASGLLYLPTNCQCSFGLKTTTAGNVAIRRAAIVIGTP